MHPEPEFAEPTAAGPDSGGAPAAAGGGGPRLQSFERRLSELTRDHRQTVRSLSKVLEEHRSTRRLADEAAGLLTEALPHLEETANGLLELRGRVDALSSELAAAPKVTAVCWPALPAEEADEVWGLLAGWISEVLGPFYRLTRGELPDCWAQHPDAVLELVWLHASYRDAFEDGNGRPGAAAEWHTRWRPAALAAVAEAIPGRLCRPGEHLVSQREADAARSDARDARTRAAVGVIPTSGRGANSGGPADGGYQPPPRAGAPATEDASERPSYDPQSQQVTAPEHWLRHFEQGRADDLAWRRRRETPASAGPDS